MKLGGGEEEVELGAPELGSGGSSGRQSGEGRGGVPVDGESGGELRLEVTGPEEGRFVGKEPRRGRGLEEAKPAAEHVLLRRDGAEERVGVGEEGVGEELEPRRRGGERGEEEERALEVGLGAGEAPGASEQQAREAQPRAGLGEREERGGVRRLERGLEARRRGGEVAPALGLLRQREEPVRRRHGRPGGCGSQYGGEGRARPRRPAWGFGELGEEGVGAWSGRSWRGGGRNGSVASGAACFNWVVFALGSRLAWRTGKNVSFFFK